MEGDENLPSELQQITIDLGRQWEQAASQEERDALHDLANQIRENYWNSVGNGGSSGSGSSSGSGGSPGGGSSSGGGNQTPTIEQQIAQKEENNVMLFGAAPEGKKGIIYARIFEEHPDYREKSGPSSSGSQGSSKTSLPPMPSPDMSVAELNRVIEQAKAVWRDYNESGGANTDTMKNIAHQYTELARSYGGTIGVPTLFVHGYSGGAGTFDNMIERLGTETDIYTIKTNQYGNCIYGYYMETNHEKNNSDHPMIQVVFEDNAASLDKQSDWVGEAVEKAKEQYGTKYRFFALRTALHYT